MNTESRVKTSNLSWKTIPRLAVFEFDYRLSTEVQQGVTPRQCPSVGYAVSSCVTFEFSTPQLSTVNCFPPVSTETGQLAHLVVRPPMLASWRNPIARYCGGTGWKTVEHIAEEENMKLVVLGQARIPAVTSSASGLGGALRLHRHGDRAARIHAARAHPRKRYEHCDFDNYDTDLYETGRDSTD